MALKRRPKKKTIKMLEYVASVEHGLTRPKVIKMIAEKYSVTSRRASTVYNQYQKEGKELIEKYSVTDRDLYCFPERDKAIDAVVCLPPVVNGCTAMEVNGITPIERLPTTEKELRQHRYDKVLSPQARALRIDMLVEASMKESGIAKMKALDALEDLTRLYGEHTDEDEVVFFDVTQTKKSK